MDALGTDGPVQALGCVHCFCRHCIARCIRTQLEARRRPDCPVCKRPIPPEEQRACGVEPEPGAVYGPAIDMFAPDDDAPGLEEDAQRAALRAAFPHAAAGDMHVDPMRLLDRHMQQQRRGRQGGTTAHGAGRGPPAGPSGGGRARYAATGTGAGGVGSGRVARAAAGAGRSGRGRARMSWP